jgi:SAM-dependent methyltransferase
MVRKTGAILVGIDLSMVALRHAQRRAASLGPEGQILLGMGDLRAMPFRSQIFDAAISFAVLFTIEDISAVLAGIARVLKPGARFMFTNWVREIAPPYYPTPVRDYRPPLATSGFEVERHEPVPGAIDRIRMVCERQVAQAERLEQEMGEIARTSILKSARYHLGMEDGIDYLACSDWVRVVARKR